MSSVGDALMHALGLAGLCAIISAIFTQWQTGKREDRAYKRKLADERRMAATVAIHVAMELESFAEACACIYVDSVAYSETGRGIGKLHHQLPNAPDVKGQDDIALLDARIANRALTFGYHAHHAQRKADFFLEHSDDREGVAKELSSDARRLGQMAVSLADDVRSEYGLPLRDEDVEWNVKRLLSEN